MQFQTGGGYGLGWSQVVLYDTNRPAFLERDLVRLSVNGNWQVWVRYCDGELVPIHTVGKGKSGFSNVESITISAL